MAPLQLKAQKLRIDYITAAGKSLSTVVGETVTSDVTLTDKDSAVYSAKTSIVSINAKKRTSAIKITGNAKDNTIYGGTKNDTLYGGNGNDSINGGTGNDKLYGDSGNDTLLGGNGKDTLTGGKGNDILTGGNGDDVFSFTTGDGNDTITDYSSGDLIKISGAFTKTNKNGNAVITMSDSGGGSITVLKTAAKNLNISSTRTAAYLMQNDECIMQNDELSSILNTDSKVISDDYNYDFNSTLTKQLNQTLVTNSTKQAK